MAAPTWCACPPKLMDPQLQGAKARVFFDDGDAAWYHGEWPVSSTPAATSNSHATAPKPAAASAMQRLLRLVGKIVPATVAHEGDVRLMRAGGSGRQTRRARVIDLVGERRR